MSDMHVAYQGFMILSFGHEDERGSIIGCGPIWSGVGERKQVDRAITEARRTVDAMRRHFNGEVRVLGLGARRVRHEA